MEKQNDEKKVCFIIMPISDQDGYEKGHFSRVYQHLIKPACDKAGFEAIRADDEVKTNYIVIDILKKILDSDIVICDLSAKNPNVLYELGLRQAFNKKSVLIKDNKTNRIFDIQGLRTIDYDENLRIDEVQKSISSIAKTLTDTYNDSTGDINSLIQLLSIKPASLPKDYEVSKESMLIMNSLNEITNRLSKLEKTGTFIPSTSNSTVSYEINGSNFKLGADLFKRGIHVGELIDFQEDYIIVKKDRKLIKIFKGDPEYAFIDDIPF